MKIRNGFVSNSSSSSFIIRGMKLTSDEIIKALNIHQEIDGLNDGDIYEFLYDKLAMNRKQLIDLLSRDRILLLEH